MNPKIQFIHTERPAYVYLRQSTMAQVRHNQESTERQYALKDKACELGWTPARVKVLDGDLGVSGAQTAGRNDFKALVADVSMGMVGAVFALEASRLARSCTDWHRLLELCAFSDTLIIDEDGCYNPADFNDQLLLGLKGTMSQAELHFIRARLQGGKLNKARKGELRRPLPVGLVYDDQGQIVLDPDSEVRQAVQFLFDTFRETGSGYAVVHKFAKEGLRFPKRAYGGLWNGKLIWGRLTDNRVLCLLKNPAYAGAYVHGRYQSTKEVAADGTLRTKSTQMPMASWTVTIREHHEAYISWDEYMENQELLERNRTNGEEHLLAGPAREGRALLQGLLVCGDCGRRLTVRYKGNGGIYATYDCNWKKRSGLLTSSCMHVRCDLVDKPIVNRILEAVKPQQIEIAVKAFEELERRESAIDNQWRMRIERVEYEAGLAQRRYEEVDPANRLVAATLEKRWNEALLAVEAAKQEHRECQRQDPITATDEQKAALLSLAKDLPRLWKAPTTNDKDRKRILRLLLKDVTVEKLPEPKQIILHLRWQGGALEDVPVTLLPNRPDQVRYPDALVEKVRQLASESPDAEIAARLNGDAIPSATGKPFTATMVKWIRYRHRIAPPQLKQPHELTVNEVAREFSVSPNVVYYWIERKVIAARRVNHGAPYWIALDDEKKNELAEWVRDSKQIQAQACPASLSQTAGGAV